MKSTRRLSCSYLYSDGTLIRWYREFHNRIEIGATVDVVFGYAKVQIWPSSKASHSEPAMGRIVIHDRYSNSAVVKLMRGATVKAVAPSIDGGSENTRKEGILVGYISMITKFGELNWTIMDRLLSSEFTIQADGVRLLNPNELTPGGTWCDIRVANVKDLRPKSESAVPTAAINVLS